MATPDRPRLRDMAWLRPVQRGVRWWRRFQRGPVLHTYPWYIEWFRHPDRIVDVAYGPALITIPLIIGGMVWAWSWASLYVLLGGIAVHLLLMVRTSRVRRRYGVSAPTRDDMIPLAEEVRLAREKREELD